MPRKIITEEQKNEVIKEATEFLKEIIIKWFGFVDKRMGIHNIPDFKIKLGGYTGWYSKELDTIGLNYYSWKKMMLAQKRLLLIHEYIHKLGLNHSGLNSYLGSYDLLSIKVYKKIFGKDNAWEEFESKIELIMNKF